MLIYYYQTNKVGWRNKYMNKKLMVLFVVLLGVLSISSVSANDSGSFNDLDTLIENNGDTVELRHFQKSCA